MAFHKFALMYFFWGTSNHKINPHGVFQVSVSSLHKWPKWRLWNQKMMYCFPYLHFSIPSTSPQPKANKNLRGYRTSSLCAGCARGVTVPHPTSHSLIKTHYLCHPVGSGYDIVSPYTMERAIGWGQQFRSALCLDHNSTNTMVYIWPECENGTFCSDIKVHS